MNNCIYDLLRMIVEILINIRAQYPAAALQYSPINIGNTVAVHLSREGPVRKENNERTHYHLRGPTDAMLQSC